VTLGLAEVDPINSCGIDVVHRLRRRLHEHQTAFVVVVPTTGGSVVQSSWSP
jgi:hypothetical protein